MPPFPVGKLGTKFELFFKTMHLRLGKTIGLACVFCAEISQAVDPLEGLLKPQSVEQAEQFSQEDVLFFPEQLHTFINRLIDDSLSELNDCVQREQA
jgi:hypothetical protein